MTRSDLCIGYVRTLSKKWILVATSVLFAVLATGCSSSSTTADTEAGSGLPALKVSGTSGGWSFHDGETISVSMGANKLFKPGIRLIILQCADPGGQKSNLPTKFLACDGNTVQGDSVIPQANGSFSETAYTIYRLPSANLGEQPSWKPICNRTHPCVLFVGENQNDFTKPKVFSHPFTVASGSSGNSA